MVNRMKVISAEGIIDKLSFDAEFLRRVIDDLDIVGVERTKYEDEIELIESYIFIIEKISSTLPEPKTGHWIPVTNGRGGHQCDRCGCYAPSYQSGTEWLSNFCPECNADMRGKEHE